MDFFQERKLLVAWHRTNEISGENLTSENHRSTSVSTQFSEKLEAETKKEKRKEKSIPPLRSRNRLEIISSANRRFLHDPGNRSTDLISWISPL